MFEFVRGGQVKPSGLPVLSLGGVKDHLSSDTQGSEKTKSTLSSTVQSNSWYYNRHELDLSSRYLVVREMCSSVNCPGNAHRGEP